MRQIRAATFDFDKGAKKPIPRGPADSICTSRLVSEKHHNRGTGMTATDHHSVPFVSVCVLTVDHHPAVNPGRCRLPPLVPGTEACLISPLWLHVSIHRCFLEDQSQPKSKLRLFWNLCH